MMSGTCTAVARRGGLAAMASSVAMLAVVPAAQAQTWRNAELSRQLRDSAPHEVSVTYAGGRFTLLAADRGVLYDARIRYDEERGTPVVSYDRAGRSLDIDVELEEESNTGGQTRFGEMRLALSPLVPLDLDIELGAVEGDISLGGLALSSVSVEAGASSSRVSFDTPNRIAMARLDLHAGAASLTATNLANANAREIRVAAGVGNLDLDFGGQWTRDIDATVDIALGRARIHVPASVGIRVEMSKVLARFHHPGLVKQGEAWVSTNWESASHRLTLRMNTTFGSVEIDRGGG